MDRLSKGEQIIGVSSLLLLVLSVLKFWAKVDAGEFGGLLAGDLKFSAWSGAFGFILKLGLFSAILALVLVGVRAGGVTLPTLPLPLGLLYLILTGITAVGLLLALLGGPVTGLERGVGLFIGTLLALAAAFGAYLHKQGEEPGPALGGGPATPPPAT